MSNLETIRKTVDAFDLALSFYPDEVIIDNDEQFAFGVTDGMRLTLAAYGNSDLTPREVVSQHLEGEHEQTLEETSRVLGMLAGSLTATRLIYKILVEPGEPQ